MAYRRARDLLRNVLNQANTGGYLVSFDRNHAEGAMLRAFKNGEPIRLGNLTIDPSAVQHRSDPDGMRDEYVRLNDSLAPALVAEVRRWSSPICQKKSVQRRHPALRGMNEAQTKAFCRDFSKILYEHKCNGHTITIQCGDNTVTLTPDEINRLQPHNTRCYGVFGLANRKTDTPQYFTLPKDKADVLCEWIGQDITLHTQMLLKQSNIEVTGRTPPIEKQPAQTPAEAPPISHVQRAGKTLPLEGERMQSYIAALEKEGWGIFSNRSAMIVQRGRKRATADVKDGQLTVAALQDIANKTQVPLPAGINTGPQIT